MMKLPQWMMENIFFSLDGLLFIWNFGLLFWVSLLLKAQEKKTTNSPSNKIKPGIRSEGKILAYVLDRKFRS